MQQFKKLNNITGWAVFAVALVVYTMTMEKTGSFWDCGEFISGAYKLQLVHPPGAPLFIMIGRMFSLFSFGDPSKVALTINFLSALSTAFVSLFAFWITTFFGKRMLFPSKGEPESIQIYTVLGAGIIAGLASTFLDSMWFSAVEGEVYALGMLFMALKAWLIVKWADSSEPDRDKYLVLIAYVAGLSVGVHLLSLLILPFVATVWYFEKTEKPGILGFILANIFGFFLVGLIMKGVISGTISMAAGFDKLFVNSLGLPFNSGAIFLLLSIVAGLIAALIYTRKAGNYNAYLASVCLLFVYLGFASWIIVPIRSVANPPINMNRPEDPFSIEAYVNREQYGDRPLLFGPAYNTQPISTKVIGEKWMKDAEEGKYVKVDDKIDYEYDPADKMPFPRLGFWQEESKKQAYRAILKPDYDVIDRGTGNVMRSFPSYQQENARQYAAELNKDGSGRYEVKDHLSFADNLSFFFRYQINYMYFRYFFWNFSGRQNDIQGTYANDDGGWIIGIPALDNLIHPWGHPRWPQDKLSASMASNKGRNSFYMIPFIIGLIGLVYTYLKHDKIFWSLLVFFGTTGIIMLVYSNEPPIEPRERDYGLVGSFFTYAVWMGLGVIAIYKMLSNRIPSAGAAALSFLIALPAPVLMGVEGWDDHNRDGRFTARDFAINYLESCQPNAIIFTQGDNDTYPLWYAQEVEGIRTDIRIVNLSLLGVDWYINQLRYKTNDAAPIKLSFEPKQIRASRRDVVRYSRNPRLPEGVALPLKNVMAFIASEDPRNKANMGYGEPDNYLPTQNFYLDIDSATAVKMNMLDAEDMDEFTPRMQWSISNGMLLKNDLMTLDIVANNIQERPIYFAVSVSPDAYLNLDKYFQLEGLAYRIVPRENKSGSPIGAPVRTDLSYNNMMKKFRFGGIDVNPDIYLDENNLRMTMNVRGNYARLAEALIAQGKNERAVEVLDFCMAKMPSDRVPYNVFSIQFPELYFRAGAAEKGRKYLKAMWDKAKDELNYYQYAYKTEMDNARSSGDSYYLAQLQQGAFIQNRGVQEQLYSMQELLTAARQFDPSGAEALDKEFNAYRVSFVQVSGMPQP